MAWLIRFRTILIPIALSLLSFAYPIYNFGKRKMEEIDWDTFEFFALLSRSSVWIYKKFPMHVPWDCGGLDQLANPQTRVFSPLGTLDLIFEPYIALWIGLIILGAFGTYGFYRLVQEEFGENNKQFRMIAWTTAFMWISCSWFSLHIVKGHIIYGAFQLVPWMAMALKNYQHRRWRIFLVGMFSWFLLEGSIYTYTFGIWFLVVCLFFGLFIRRRGIVWEAIVKNPLEHLILIAFHLMSSAPKTLPLMALIRDRTPQGDGNRPMNLWEMSQALFNPFQSAYRSWNKELIYGFHEFGTYFSLIGLGFLIFAFILWLKPHAKSPWIFNQSGWQWIGWLGAAVFWFWVASRWLTPYNPWSAYSRIPFFNQAHVQSRTFIFLYFMFVVVLARCLVAYSKRIPKTVSLVCLILLVEAIGFRQWTWWDGYQHSSRAMPKGWPLIESTSIKTVTPGGDRQNYYRGQSSVQCFLKSHPGTNVIAHTDPKYRGEIYPSADGVATINRYTPGEISVSLKSAPRQWYTINTNTLLGWKSDHEYIEVDNHAKDRLLRFRPTKETTTIDFKLYYSPATFWPSVILWLLGWGGIIYWWRRPESWIQPKIR